MVACLRPHGLAMRVWLPLTLLHPLPRRLLSMSAERRPVLVLCGPTSVGKSALAREVCSRTPSEVLVADAVQVYRRLDIGANKPSAEERAAVPHHLVDVCSPPGETLTAGDFVRTAVPAVAGVLQRGRLPVFVGGNTMWVQWLV